MLNFVAFVIFKPGSHLLHKRKESDIRKRNELQNEVVGVSRYVFKTAEDEILLLLLLLCGCQIPFTHNFLITAAFISETCECLLTSTNTKDVFF